AQDLLTTDRYAHLVGGCPMGASPETSVVDAGHRVWGVPNLIVADGSVLPTQGSANPALTIMALSSRLADGLAPAQSTRRIRALLRLVRVLGGGERLRPVERLVEVALLDRQGPLHELADAGVARLLVHGAQHGPVPDLRGLRHRQELEAVEHVRVVVQV